MRMGEDLLTHLEGIYISMIAMNAEGRDVPPTTPITYMRPVIPHVPIDRSGLSTLVTIEKWDGE